MRVVYIAGLGHSGSTLLDLLIGAHSQVVSVGEVVNVRAYAHLLKRKGEQSKLGNECTCGAASIWECPFWTRVEARLGQASGLSLRDLDLKARDPGRLARENRALFAAVAAASGQRIVVDSSKDPRRLASLVRTPGLEVFPIHLFRGPRGVVNSQLKRRPGLLRACLAFNVRTAQIRALLVGRPHALVRYERLVADAAGVLRPLMDRLGLAFEDAQLAWAGRERHNLGGNWMRRAQSSEIRLDGSWQRELSGAQRAAIDLLTLPARLALGVR